jgi:hypothetical protein
MKDTLKDIAVMIAIVIVGGAVILFSAIMALIGFLAALATALLPIVAIVILIIIAMGLL